MKEGGSDAFVMRSEVRYALGLMKLIVSDSELLEVLRLAKCTTGRHGNVDYMKMLVMLGAPRGAAISMRQRLLWGRVDAKQQATIGEMVQDSGAMHRRRIREMGKSYSSTALVSATLQLTRRTELELRALFIKEVEAGIFGHARAGYSAQGRSAIGVFRKALGRFGIHFTEPEMRYIKSKFARASAIDYVSFIKFYKAPPPRVLRKEVYERRRVLQLSSAPLLVASIIHALLQPKIRHQLLWNALGVQRASRT